MSSDSDYEDDVTHVDNHYKTLLKLENQRRNEEFCDVTLKVDNDKLFPAHRNILAASSDYFKAMFTIEMEEKSKKIVSIQSVTSQAMEQVLNCIYTGKVTITETNISETLHAASMMQLENLLQVCQDFMKAALNTTNCCLFWDLSTLYSFDEVVRIVHQVFLSSFEDIKNQPNFLELNADTMHQILSSDDLNVAVEKSVFEFVVNWVNNDLETRKECFPALFRHIRLQFIPIKEVIGAIRANNLVKEFHECRDLVEDAFSYYITPNVFAAQMPRKCLASKPDAMLLLQNEKTDQKIYNCTNNKLSQPDMPPLYGLTTNTILRDCAAAVQHPITVLCGGVQNFESSKQVVRFDGIRWMKMPSMNVARCGAAAVFFNGDLYVFGGEISPVSVDSTFSQCGLEFAQSYEKFNQDWEVFPSKLTSRSYWVARSYRDTIYLIGGFVENLNKNSSQRCKVACRSTFAFYPAKNVWRNGPKLNNNRASFSCALVNSKIFVVGGVGDGGSKVTSVEVLNLSPRRAIAWTTLYSPVRFDVNINSACGINNEVYAISKNFVYRIDEQSNSCLGESCDMQFYPTLCISIAENLLTRSILKFDT